MKLTYTHKRRAGLIKPALVALAVTLIGMLGLTAASAQAAPLAPEITVEPSDPNTTEARPTIHFKVADGDPEAAAIVAISNPTNRFMCRLYLEGNAPGAFTTCATGADVVDGLAQASKWLVSGNFLMNDPTGDYVFEVFARTASTVANNVPNGPASGPVATATWTNDLAPPPPPGLTTSPSSPNPEALSRFVFGNAPSELGLVNEYRCKLDEDIFHSCESPYDVSGANGEHKLEIRGINQFGDGPVLSHEWTVEVPDTEPSLTLEEAAETRWDGTAANTNLGGYTSGQPEGITNAGDINEDGIDDLLVGTHGSSAAHRGVYVLFGPQGHQAGGPLQHIGPNAGYKINPPGAFGTASLYADIGDQNDDGVSDQLVAPDGGFEAYVVYGVKDPSTLPLCAGETVTRCLNLAGVVGSDGDLGYGIMPGVTIAGAPMVGAIGDFDGDGFEDFAAGTIEMLGLGNGHLIKGGVERSGMVMTASIPAEEKLEITPQTSIGNFFNAPQALGDLNSDGHDDLALYQYNPPGAAGLTDSLHGVVLFGGEFGGDPVDLGQVVEDGEGFRLLGGPLSRGYVSNLGDINGDGNPDFRINSDEGDASSRLRVEGSTPGSVTYGPDMDDPSGAFLTYGFDLEPGDGYLLDDPGNLSWSNFGRQMINVGDVNGDGVPDQLATAPGAAIDGAPYYGAAYLTFGQRDAGEKVDIGSGLTPEVGVAIENADGLQVPDPGQTNLMAVTPLGDQDGDDLVDFAVSVPWNNTGAGANSGSVYIIYGKSFLAEAKTGNAVAVGNESAVLNAGVSTNDRDSEVHFEYGTSDEYGEVSSIDEIEASNTGSAASAAVNGLTKNTTYHYRAVIKNDLGLVKYGDDKTFTTTNTADPDPVETCDIDPTGPGCAGFCDAHSTAIGCPGYDVCAAQPNKCSGRKTNAKLGLITSPKTIKVKRGKKGSVSAIVYNSGGKQAKNVKVCVKAPKKFIKVKKCQTFGSIGSGATKTKQFKVRVKKKAKKGKKITLKFTATSGNAGKKTTKAKVVVQK